MFPNSSWEIPRPSILSQPFITGAPHHLHEAHEVTGAPVTFSLEWYCLDLLPLTHFLKQVLGLFFFIKWHNVSGSKSQPFFSPENHYFMSILAYNVISYPSLPFQFP